MINLLLLVALVHRMQGQAGINLQAMLHIDCYLHRMLSNFRIRPIVLNQLGVWTNRVLMLRLAHLL
jgi:hypothetical protein